MLHVSLQQQYFDAIKSGLKTVEGRLNSPKFQDLKPGMHISFSCINTNEIIVYTVEAIHVYANFADMLHNEGIDLMLPGITSIDEGVALYENFPGYRDDVKKFGALAIKFKNSSDV